MSIVHEHPVGFEEIDAAGIVFFARFFYWCHDAMERFFDPVDGGYVGLVMKRRIGFPAVHATADWRAPFRYGDAARIEVSILHVGTTSVTFRFEVTRVSAVSGDTVSAATFEHVCVATALDSLQKVPLPDDCRALLQAHLVSRG